MDGAIWALGAMSGTSLDGVDAAMLLTDGRAIAEFGESRYRARSGPDRAVVAAALGAWPGDAGVAEAAVVVEREHVELLSTFQDAALVGFHGQTLAHEPRGRGTHQVGDGRALSRALGLPVVWDFRGEDVRRGGEGAPLAPFFHHACARWAGLEEPVAFLNLGGVGNMTWLDPRASDPSAPGALLAFDTGPANAPLDDMVRSRGLGSFDEGGRLAASGTPDEALVEAFLMDPYFARKPPKSLDRNAFSEIFEGVAGLSSEDAAATLTLAAARSAGEALRHCPDPPRGIYVTGGGRANPEMMTGIASSSGCGVEPVEVLGLDGDMLEAQAFAYLAARVTKGLPTSAPGTTGVDVPVCGGVVSRP